MLRREEVVALVTAAGASSRMGRPKALVAWPPGAGTTLVEHQVRALAGFRAIVVVTGAHAFAPPAPAVEAHNARWAEGRSTSLEVGAAALPDDARAVLVTAVDQPLDPDVVDALLATLDLEQDDAVQPMSRATGRRGHPLVLAGRHLAALRQASRFPEGLRGILAAHPARAVPVDSPAIHLDLNTPADVV
ncbi:MAG: nucleotidyltransferase family protein [Myxococcota bacterium]